MQTRGGMSRSGYARSKAFRLTVALLLFVAACGGSGDVDLDALTPVEKVAVIADRNADREQRWQALGDVSLEVIQLREASVTDAKSLALLDAIAARLLTHKECWVRTEALEQISAYARLLADDRAASAHADSSSRTAHDDATQRVQRAAHVAAEMIEAPASCDADDEPVCYVDHPRSAELTQLGGRACAQREAAHFLWQTAPLLDTKAVLEPVAQLALTAPDAILRYAAAQLLDGMHSLNPHFVRGVAQRLTGDVDPHVRQLAGQMLRIAN